MDPTLDIEELLKRPICNGDLLQLMHEYPAMAKRMVDATGVTNEEAALWMIQKQNPVSEEWDAAIKAFLVQHLHPTHL